MDDIASRKAVARKSAFARRAQAQDAMRNAEANKHLQDFLLPFRGLPLAGYMAIRTEIDPLPVMAAMAKFAPVCVPVIQGAGQALVFHRWNDGADMQAGPFGAKIPLDPEPIIPRIIILPLVAFDARGFRLGYGGGFYDRTLEQLRASGQVRAIGFAYSGQLAEALPIEPTDQPLDAIVTENGVTHF